MSDGRLESACAGVQAVITGANGFLGRALAARLAQSGARITGIDVQQDPLSANVERYVRADITDLAAVRTALAELQSLNATEVVVFHLAGMSHVGLCQANPLTAYLANVTGTVNVLEACRERGFLRIVFPSTALVYARPTTRPIEETDPVAPASFYAATKRACEVLLAAYADSHGMHCQVARLGNVYGPGGARDSVVSIVVDQIRRGTAVTLRTLTPVRDFIYRDDVVRGLMAMAVRSREPGCEVFNLGSGIATSIRELAETACSVAGVPSGVSEIGDGSSPLRGNEDLCVLSVRRLADSCQWRPVWTLAEGLRQTLRGEDSNKNA